MKLKLLLLLLLLFSLSTFAKERKIRIRHDRPISVSLHTPTFIPEVSIDNTKLYVYSRNIEDIQILVKNEKTGFVIFNITASLSGGEKRLVYTDLKKGSYKIELKISDNTYVGYFDINETDTF